MKTYLLIHGALRGAWLWERVMPLLQKGGANPIALDLPGHGTRAGERRGVTMSTYIADVIDFIRRENLRELVLVGHSMSGIIISKIAEEMPARVKHLAYLAAVVPPGSSALIDLLPKERQETLRKQQGTATEVFGTIESLRPGYFTDLEGEEQERYLRRLTPEPLAAFFDRITFNTFPDTAVPRTYIMGMRDKALPPALTAGFAGTLRVDPVRIEAGHDMMVSRPGEVAEVLLSVA
ncbi:MAG: alpha/beta hydrolase [Nitrospiraceae bacterium]|nr:alpha/beta hydrolase [Nitrospiraceae bacterium]